MNYIVIPENILDENLSLKPNAILLYGIIHSYSRTNGFLFASNNYLADKFNVSIRTIQRLLEQLQEKKLITIDFEETSSGATRRTVKATNAVFENIDSYAKRDNKRIRKEIDNQKTQYQRQLNAKKKSYKNLLPNDIESDWFDDYMANMNGDTTLEQRLAYAIHHKMPFEAIKDKHDTVKRWLNSIEEEALQEIKNSQAFYEASMKLNSTT